VQAVEPAGAKVPAMQAVTTVVVHELPAGQTVQKTEPAVE
jgi:hypothetical protein